MFVILSELNRHLNELSLVQVQLRVGLYDRESNFIHSQNYCIRANLVFLLVQSCHPVFAIHKCANLVPADFQRKGLTKAFLDAAFNLNHKGLILTRLSVNNHEIVVRNWSSELK